MMTRKSISHDAPSWGAFPRPSTCPLPHFLPPSSIQLLADPSLHPPAPLPLLEHLLPLLDVLVAHALAPPVAPLQAVQHVLPHRPGRLQPLGPLAAAHQLPLEAPHPREALGAQEAPLPRL